MPKQNAVQFLHYGVISWLSNHDSLPYYNACKLASAQCIVIGPVCGFVFCGCVCLWVCYHDNSKLCALILTKLGL